MLLIKGTCITYFAMTGMVSILASFFILWLRFGCLFRSSGSLPWIPIADTPVPSIICTNFTHSSNCKHNDIVVSSRPFKLAVF